MTLALPITFVPNVPSGSSLTFDKRLCGQVQNYVRVNVPDGLNRTMSVVDIDHIMMNQTFGPDIAKCDRVSGSKAIPCTSDPR